MVVMENQWMMARELDELTLPKEQIEDRQKNPLFAKQNKYP